MVLAVIGGTAGWILAGSRGRDVVAGPGPSASASSSLDTTPTSATPTDTVEPSAPPSGGAGDGFPLPDVTNVDFEQARKQLRDLRLGVQLIFAANGDSRLVERTQPAGGNAVRRGITVKVFVRGGPPFATIPDVRGLTCGQVGTTVADHGLVPEYPTGRNGVVLRLDPEPGPDKLRWNDKLRVFCGTPTPSTAAG